MSKENETKTEEGYGEGTLTEEPNNNHITVYEGECYMGSPYAGYALYGNSKKGQ